MGEAESGDIKAAAAKATAALSAIRGDQTVHELAVQYGVEPAQIEAWKRHLERFLQGGFSAKAEAHAAPAAASVEDAAPSDATGAASNIAPMYRTLPDLPTIRSLGAQGVPSEAGDTATGLQDHQYQMLVLALESELLEHGRAGQARQGARNWLAEFLRRNFVGWMEDRQARKTSRELLQLYAKAKADHPGKSGVALYRQILFDRLGGSVVAAEAVLVRAEESFASWPTTRPLKFRDVAHCLAVMEYLQSNRGARWTRKDFRHRVASYIPENL